MANEQVQHEETAEQDKKDEATPEKSGNFFGRYGKIFLIVCVLMAQAGAAYAVLNSYYQNISGLLEGLSSKEKVYYSFENIIINPARSGGERYLILSLAVEVNTGDEAALLDKYSAEIIDKMSQILTNYTARELADLGMRDEIKQEIGIMINDSISEKAVRNLFFTKYVLQ